MLAGAVDRAVSVDVPAHQRRGVAVPVRAADGPVVAEVGQVEFFVGLGAGLARKAGHPVLAGLHRLAAAQQADLRRSSLAAATVGGVGQGLRLVALDHQPQVADHHHGGEVAGTDRIHPAGQVAEVEAVISAPRGHAADRCGLPSGAELGLVRVGRGGKQGRRVQHPPQGKDRSGGRVDFDLDGLAAPKDAAVNRHVALGRRKPRHQQRGDQDTLYPVALYPSALHSGPFV